MQVKPIGQPQPTFGIKVGNTKVSRYAPTSYLVEDMAVTVLDEETGEVINQGIDIDVKALKIELKANHFYRGNPYVDAVGGLLGFTKEQMDAFFETKDYTALIS